MAANTTRPAAQNRRFLWVVLLTTLMMLVGLELAVRLTFDHLDLMALTGQVPGPNGIEQWAYIDAFSAYRGIPGQYEQADKTVNSHGFISTPELDVAKPEDTTRVVFLGGSSTAGTGHNLPDNQTWPWQVHQILQGNYPEQNIEFINAALGGYSSFESYGRLWSRVRFFSPDVIVVYHAWNEMYYFEASDIETIHNWRTNADGSWSFMSITQRFEPLPIDRYIHRSQTLTYFRIIFAEANAGGEVGQGVTTTLADTYDPQGLEIWRTNLNLIQNIADVIGADLYVVKQATLITPDLPENERDRARVWVHGFDYDAHIRAFDEIYAVIDEEVPQANIIDATPLSGEPNYFYDHVHLTVEGSTELAQLVANELRPSFGQVSAAEVGKLNDDHGEP